MAANRPKRIYWDSCAWIGFINSESDKIQPPRAIWEDAERGKYEIFTSAYSYLEVIKGVVPYGEAYPSEESDENFERMVSQNWVKRVQLDIPVARMARSLKRRFHKDGLGKRPDAIHLASAVFHNCEELHTFDAMDLLHLDKKVNTRSGIPLVIRKPDLSDIPEPLFASAARRDDLMSARRRIIQLLRERGHGRDE